MNCHFEIWRHCIARQPRRNPQRHRPDYFRGHVGRRTDGQYFRRVREYAGVLRAPVRGGRSGRHEKRRRNVFERVPGRDRSGAADQRTSFSVGYNICLAVRSLGLDTDYHLVWDTPHGSEEGTSTGTFIDWIHEICA